MVGNAGPAVDDDAAQHGAIPLEMIAIDRPGDDAGRVDKLVRPEPVDRHDDLHRNLEWGERARPPPGLFDGSGHAA